MTVQRSEKEEILEALREFRQRLEAASDDEAREMVTVALEAEAALEAT